ncbi:MAG: hypothetical protein WBD00_08005 [Candidatus Omnitrophota bacterium]
MKRFIVIFHIVVFITAGLYPEVSYVKDWKRIQYPSEGTTKRRKATSPNGKAYEEERERQERILNAPPDMMHEIYYSDKTYFGKTLPDEMEERDEELLHRETIKDEYEKRKQFHRKQQELEDAEREKRWQEQLQENKKNWWERLREWFQKDKKTEIVEKTETDEKTKVGTMQYLDKDGNVVTIDFEENAK